MAYGKKKMVKATGMKKAVSTKRGDDKRPSGASVKKSLKSDQLKKLSKIKF